MITFTEQFRKGQVSAERINDHIHAWHESLDTEAVTRGHDMGTVLPLGEKISRR